MSQLKYNTDNQVLIDPDFLEEIKDRKEFYDTPDHRNNLGFKLYNLIVSLVEDGVIVPDDITQIVRDY